MLGPAPDDPSGCSVRMAGGPDGVTEGDEMDEQVSVLAEHGKAERSQRWLFVVGKQWCLWPAEGRQGCRSR